MRANQACKAHKKGAKHESKEVKFKVKNNNLSKHCHNKNDRHGDLNHVCLFPITSETPRVPRVAETRKTWVVACIRRTNRKVKESKFSLLLNTFFYVFCRTSGTVFLYFFYLVIENFFVNLIRNYVTLVIFHRKPKLLGPLSQNAATVGDPIRCVTYDTWVVSFSLACL